MIKSYDSFKLQHLRERLAKYTIKNKKKFIGKRDRIRILRKKNRLEIIVLHLHKFKNLIWYYFVIFLGHF